MRGIIDIQCSQPLSAVFLCSQRRVSANILAVIQHCVDWRVEGLQLDLSLRNIFSPQFICISGQVQSTEPCEPSPVCLVISKLASTSAEIIDHAAAANDDDDDDTPQDSGAREEGSDLIGASTSGSRSSVFAVDNMLAPS